jgi:hypothetical protein
LLQLVIIDFIYNFPELSQWETNGLMGGQWRGEEEEGRKPQIIPEFHSSNIVSAVFMGHLRTLYTPVHTPRRGGNLNLSSLFLPQKND